MAPRRVGLVADPDHGQVVGPADHLIGHEFHLLLHLIEAAPHEALDGEDGLLGVRDRLPLGRVADQDFPLVGEGDDAGRQAVAPSLAMTVTSLPSMTATTELVVPRSMPMIFSSAIAVLPPSETSCKECA